MLKVPLYAFRRCSQKARNAVRKREASFPCILAHAFFCPDRLFNLAMAKFDTALSSTPDNQLILKNWGDALCEQMKSKTGEERDRLVWKAIDKYQQMRCTSSLMKLGELLHRLIADQTAEER